ncbi:hypothetical protein R5R35_005611 [Gryllus longicercus]|uniref:Peptidase S1 domain-containing protein n=1 Tax=Gryllus longicercus TaxID=2509291 RepID=A0AAN9VD64_9ORTH
MDGPGCPFATLLLALSSMAAYHSAVIVEVPPDPDAEMIETLKNVSFQVHVVTFLGKGRIEFCNGAIIEKRHILTAASCVLKAQIEGIPKVQVMVQHGNGSNTAIFDVVSHTFYDKQLHEHVEEDIVILQTDRPMLSEEELKRTVDLQTKKRYRSKHCSLAGWTDERNMENAINSHLKMQLPTTMWHLPPPTPLWQLHAVAWKRCFHEDSIHKPPRDLICIGKRGFRRNTCQEEPGAPVLCDGQLTGVVAGSLGCSNATFALLYTDVGYYRRWIDATLREHQAQLQALDLESGERLRAQRPPQASDGDGPPRRRRRPRPRRRLRPESPNNLRNALMNP